MNFKYLVTYHLIKERLLNNLQYMTSFAIFSDKSDIDKDENYKSVYNKLLQYLPEATLPENANSSMLFIDLSKIYNDEDIAVRNIAQLDTDVSDNNLESALYNIDATVLIRTSVPKTSVDMLRLYVVIQTKDNRVHTATYCIPQNYMPQEEIENALSEV